MTLGSESKRREQNQKNAVKGIMILERLTLTNFRNYRGFDLEWSPGVNMIWGANAQGKTNLLEAIYFLSAYSSFRPGVVGEMVGKSGDFFYVGGDFISGGLKQTVKAGYSLRKKYALKLDGNVKRRLGDMIGVLNAVVFSPDDLFLMKGNPEERRRFLDGEIAQMSPQSYAVFQRYHKTLRQRNNLLKELRDGGGDSAVHAAFDRQLAESGGYILWKRKEALDRLLPLTRLAHRRITDGREELILSYVGGFDFLKESELRRFSLVQWQDTFYDVLQDLRKEDIRRGTTTFGPHRDDISFTVNGDDVKKFGSQGQQRTATLALKIGELELMKGQRGEYPILLLDDVLSELDQDRRTALIGVVNEKIQTFITGTKEQDFIHRFLHNGNGLSIQIAGGVVLSSKSV